jgi:hypothetical protein
LGVNGVITIKMIRRTSKTSMRGVTFISAIAPPELPPTAILIVLPSLEKPDA